MTASGVHSCGQHYQESKEHVDVQAEKYLGISSLPPPTENCDLMQRNFCAFFEVFPQSHTWQWSALFGELWLFLPVLKQLARKLRLQ